jgi:hypothetical protein
LPEPSEGDTSFQVRGSNLNDRQGVKSRRPFPPLKQLEAENAQMKRIIARKELELDAVRELIEKSGWGPQPAKSR